MLGMLYPRSSRRRLAIYLIPILIGLGGVAFSRQIDTMWLRMAVVLASVSVPLFAGGNLLARFRGGRFERVFLWFGISLLLLGAAVSVSGVGDSLLMDPEAAPILVGVSRWIGILSLSLGLFVVLFSVVRAGEDIEEVAERFWHLAEHITEGFVLSTSEGVIFLVNKQFLEMTDLREEEVIGQSAANLAERLNIMPMQDHLQKRREGVASEYEVTWRVRGEERRLWFSGTPIYDDHGRHTANLATVRDVTEFHRLSQRVERYAESLKELVEEQSKKLVQSEERFRQLLLSMNEGFLTLDTANRIRFANARACQMLEISAEEIVGRDIFDFVAPDGRVRLLNLLAKSSAADPADNRQEFSLVSAGNEVLPVLAGVSYLREEGSSGAMYSLVVTNVSDLKEMQDELAARADELENANEQLMLHDRAKDSFLSNVSHELRTPISTVQGYLEMLESGTLGEPHPAQLNAVRVMQRNVHRLLGLINEMIDFSRMEIRGITLQPNLYSPGSLAQESVASFVPQAQAKGVKLSSEEWSEACIAWGDRERLAQVLGILINNALKFTPEGGEVQVRVGQTDESTLYISVADTGIGIDPAYQERVFDKFFQVDSSKSRRYEGAGIGLAIAKSIVEAHGGSVTVRSAVGQGSTFTMLLPGTVFDLSTPLPYEGPPSVIAIDESGLLSTAMSQLFAGSALRIRRVSGGAHCLREAENEVPDLIVVNDSPEDIAGEVSVNLIRRDLVLSRTPVLVCTAEQGTRRSDLAGRWSGVHFLTKPFTVDQLAAQMARLDSATEVESQGEAHGLAGMPEPSYRARVLVVDSDPGLLEWLETAFAGRDILCYCAASVPDAVRMLANDPPNVIFVDVDFPGSHAQEQLHTLCQAPGADGKPVYVMTGNREMAMPGNGVRGLLHKPFAFREMLTLVPLAPRRDAD